VDLLTSSIFNKPTAEAVIAAFVFETYRTRFLERLELSVAIERLERLNQPLLVGSDRGWQFELYCEGEEPTRIQSGAARSNFIFSADPGGIPTKIDWVITPQTRSGLRRTDG
jgi:hypothetical protein